MKFQKGDTVKVIVGVERLEAIGIYNQLFHGFRGEIINDIGSALKYDVHFVECGDYLFDEHDLELVEPKTEVVNQSEKTDPQLFGHPRFYEILKDMADLHSRKNHDYAGTLDPLKNLRACTRIDLEPFMGVLVRLQDKWSRLEEFVKSGKLMVKNESVIDTLMDNAVYSILAIILYEEQLKENVQPFIVPKGWKIGDTVHNNDCGWYVFNSYAGKHLHKDFQLRSDTGYCGESRGEAPGYWPTEEAAEDALKQYLEK